MASYDVADVAVARTEVEDFSLFGLLGRSWQLDAEIVDVVIDNNDNAAAFALADGSVAIARFRDSEPAATRIRVSAETGQSTILPRMKPLPAITRFKTGSRNPVAISAYGSHGFVAGDGAGSLISVTTNGERTPFRAPLDGPITAIDHVPETGRLACVTGGAHVHLLARHRRDSECLDHPAPIMDVRFSPSGDMLAVGHQDGISLWNVEQAPIKIRDMRASEKPITLAWSRDQSKLGYGCQNSGAGLFRVSDGSHLALPNYPSPVRSIAWNSKNDSMVTSGAFRIIAWPLGTRWANGSSPTTIDTGKPSLVTIEAVAAHPRRPLVAAGYENGMLVVAELGKRDELLIKPDGQGAVSRLKWSKDGHHLALGFERGLAALVELPEQLFK